MIARFWRGVTKAKDHHAYLEYLNKTGVHDILKTQGNRGIHLLHRVNGNEAEFLFISLWDSLDAIRNFAGPHEEIAVYYPQDRAFLLELTPKVIYYELEKFEVPKGAGAGIETR